MIPDLALFYDQLSVLTLAEAISMTVVPIRILIRTTVMRITPLIGTTVVRIRILIGTTGIRDFLRSLVMLNFAFSLAIFPFIMFNG